ncbi:MAG: FAD-dependent oxidoreductase [Devosia nanyangense]|uniref:FAD-dependent oxidoreductase n=1 Tax=Devosia nanyangense TaxID=1228055 RepID=A0A933L4W9_9HYPH|nr:FAD-dependent oxidoreductase [Devosia nanyangense]
MTQPHRLAANAAHQFGGIELDRARPLSFRVNGRRVDGFAGDTVLSALLANGVDTFGRLGETALALTDAFCPLAAPRGAKPEQALPIDRLPAAGGLDLVTIGPRRATLRDRLRRAPSSLDHVLGRLAEPALLRDKPETSLTADLLVVGGGVAGLAAAEAASAAGRSVVLIERRPWLGGDARYFGPVGDEESPELLTSRLVAQLAPRPNVTLLTRAEALAIAGSTVLAHVTDASDSVPRGKIAAIAAGRILLATGARQRLPVFGGNRLPGVMTAISAYHLAKRFGVTRGRTAVVVTESNFGYRLALRLSDAGAAIGRIVDPRLNPQSRFVDFSKASGLTLASGQLPLAATAGRHGALRVALANSGTTTAATEIETDRLIVSGGWQPELSLWMLAGGSARWNPERRWLEAHGHLQHLALAGSVAGWRSMRAAIASGRAAAAQLFGLPAEPVEDIEIAAPFETPDAPTPIGPVGPTGPAFLDSGTTLTRREDDVRTSLAHHGRLSLGDVAASVELKRTLPTDAGAIAEERGAPGADLAASDWVHPVKAPPADPPWLAGRFGPDPQRVHLVVDDRCRFELGALVYPNTSPPDPQLAAGVIVETAPAGGPGGIALVSRAALKKTDRFIVETLRGPSPARVAAKP